MKQKHFMDIQNLIEFDTEFKKSNAGAFRVGDYIQLSEKIDGSSASVARDLETGELCAFSRRQPLGFSNTLNGFWNWVQRHESNFVELPPELFIFGEWTGARNKLIYDKDKTGEWYVYDAYDREHECWLPQEAVKVLCRNYGLTYVHVLYEGQFISWDHCRTFLHSPAYGDRQEGLCAKNMSALNSKDSYNPFYLKIVNEDFKETMNAKKEVSPEEKASREHALELTKSIVTPARVEKRIFALRDEGLITLPLAPQDMGQLAKLLPRAVYEDCMKEQAEVVNEIGEAFGKMCGSEAMKIARAMILQ